MALAGWRENPDRILPGVWNGVCQLEGKPDRISAGVQNGVGRLEGNATGRRDVILCFKVSVVHKRFLNGRFCSVPLFPEQL